MLKKKVLSRPKSKHGQEEIVGFGLIIIIVAVVILSLLFFILSGSKKQSVESYEVQSFIQSSLQYTTSCQGDFGNFSIKDLIFQCQDQQNCLDNKSSCDVLNSTLEGIVDSSWKVGESSPVKGYVLSVNSGGQQDIIKLKAGNETQQYKGSSQDFSQGSGSIRISLKVYY